jgi:ABC-2 type transport system permease protein
MSFRMSKLWVVFGREYTERVRARWFAISTVFGPVLFGAILFLPPWLAKREHASTDVSRIIILDATGTHLGQHIAFALSGGLTGDTSGTIVQSVTPEALAAAESAATTAVVRRTSRGYLVLDRTTLAGVSARYEGSNASAVLDMQQLQRVVRETVVVERLQRLGVRTSDATAITRASLKLDTERITESGRAVPGKINILFAFGIATLLYTSILMYGQNVLRGVLEEKQTHVAEVVIASVSAEQLLSGKVLGVGAVGLTQVFIWATASFAMFHARDRVLSWIGAPHMPLELPAISASMAALLLAFFVLGYTFYAALFATVGALVNSEVEAQQAQLPIVLMLVSTMVFVEPILSMPDGSFAHVLSALPFSAPIVMPLRLSLVPPSQLETVLSLLCLVAGCYVAVFVAARIYRVGLLMYGKRPSARELWHWVRYEQ